jgi:low temperature requirement protein LtrA
MICVELAVPIWAEQATETPWHAHHIAERYSSMTIIALGECMLGVANAVTNILASSGWSWQLVLISLGGMGLVFCLWWVYFLLPSAEALHIHRERSLFWGYGHFFVFAAIAAIGASLEVVADIFNAAPLASDAGIHHVTPLLAISFVALNQSLFMVSIWLVWSYLTRAKVKQWWLLAVNIICAGVIIFAVAQGLPLAMAIPLLCIGPVIAIAYNEYGKRHCIEYFSIR